MKICPNGPGHMTMSKYGEKLQKSSSSGPRGDDLESWYTASATQVLPMFSYDDPEFRIRTG